MSGQIDWNGDGLTDLVTLDAEGYLVLFERRKEKDQRLSLQPPRRVFWAEGPSVFDSHGKPKHDVSGLLRLNDATMSEPGRSGRRTFCFMDWDGDGIRDLVVNSQPNVSWYRGLGRTAAGEWSFRYEGPMAQPVLAGHSTTPAAVDWNRDGVQDVVIAAEDGFFYLLKNPRPAR